MNPPIAKQPRQGRLRLVQGGGDSLGFLNDLAETVIPEADAATAVPRPTQVDRIWVEHQADQLVEEQAQLYEAEGLAASRADDTTAAGLEVAAAVAAQRVEGATREVETTRQYAVDSREALSPYVTRPPSAKGWYLVRMAALYVGDVAAVTGACVLLGEIPALAATLAASTGAAAVISGMAGSEAKRVRLSRERQVNPDELPKSLTPWRHLFNGGQAGRGIVKTMALATGGILVSLGTGVVALRSGLDGWLSGLAFGTFSLAVSLGSLWNCYDYADDVSDLLDAADKACRKAEQRHRKAGDAPVIRRHQAALAAAASIQAEHTARGQAAGHHIRATLFAVLGRHPQIVGHGGEPAVKTTNDDLKTGATSSAIKRATSNTGMGQTITAGHRSRKVG